MPERIFAQEYLAEFLTTPAASSGGLWTRRRRGNWTRRNRAGHIAVDVTDAADFTVVRYFDATTREQVYIDRFNRVGYQVLEDRLEAAYRLFNADDGD